MKISEKIIILGLLIVAVSACQKPPKLEIDETKIIFDSAQIENIDKIYPVEFQILQDSINLILEGIEREKSKLGFRKYDKYKNQLKNLNNETRQLINNQKEKKLIEEESGIETESEV